MKYFLALLFIFPLSNAALADTQVPSQTFQLANGNCNLVLNIQNGQTVKIPQMCADLSSNKSVADSLRKISIFIEASNPTEIELSDVDLVHWVGDAEKYLTFSLKNISNLPAEKIKVRILDALKANEKNSRVLSFYPSKAYPKSVLDNLGIPKSHSTQIPIASISELSNISQPRVSSGFDLIGTGLRPKLSDNMRESYVKSKGLSDNYNFDSETIGFGVEITYSNVFGASTTILTSFYLYYGHVSGT